MATSTHYHNSQYKQVLETAITEIQHIKGTTRQEVYAELNMIIASAVKRIELLAHKNPIEMPLNLDNTNNWRDVIDAISQQAIENEKKGTIVNNIVYGDYNKDCIANHKFISPLSISGNDIYRKDGNVVIFYDNNTKQKAIERLNNITFSLILSLPPKKVRLSIIDFGMDGAAGMLTRGLDPEIYHDEVIVEQGHYSDLLKRLQATMAQRIKKYGDIMEQNEKAQKIHEPIELVLLIGDPDRFDYHMQELQPIWENGRKGGILFICLKNCDIRPAREDVKPALTGLNFVEVSASGNQYKINSSDEVRLTPVAQLPELAKLCFDYINTGFRQKEAATKIVEKIVDTSDYDDCSDGNIEVAVGETEQRIVNFTMNLVDHIHAFVLGMSGSGKSVLLHNIIANLINKYSPQHLELYLMDFKLGGVEFNRYHDTKHVKALLVDNSDNGVVLEILRELSIEMYERGKALKNAGVQRIDEYNAKNSSSPLPQILVVIDECQNLFNLEGGNQTPTQREVNEIIKKITKEGRSQGVHLILATQTLSGAEISQDILNNISDHYLLKSSQSDSEKLAPNSSQVTFGLPTGKVYYHHQSGVQLFQGYYIGDDKLENKVIAANKKANDSKSNGQFYFSGSQVYLFGDEAKHKIHSLADNLIVTPGEVLSLRHRPVAIKLPRETAQNILVTGLCDMDQYNEPIESPSIRSVLAVIASMVAKNQMMLNPYDIVVVNCLEPKTQLEEWANQGEIKLLSGDVKAGEKLALLSHAVKCEKARPTFVVIIGQQKFKQLKKSVSITVDEIPPTSNNWGNFMTLEDDRMIDPTTIPPDPIPHEIPSLAENDKEEKHDDEFGFDAKTGNSFAVSKESHTQGLTNQSVKQTNEPEKPERIIEVNVANALETILKLGPEQNVHTLIQIDRPQNILFDDGFTYSKKNVQALFAHILAHKGDEASDNTLGLRDKKADITQLTNDEERLKAYYYNVDTDTVLAYSPFVLTL